jgi:hypothetical protein
MHEVGFYCLPGCPGAGQVRVYRGGPGFNFDLGLELEGLAPENRFGFEVAGAGDLDGDGYEDLVVGEPCADVTGLDAGTTHIYLGAETLVIPSPALLQGQVMETFGANIARIGDANGDGLEDLAIASPAATTSTPLGGRVRVFHGSPGLDLAPDVVLEGTVLAGLLGWALSGSDVNGDGYADVLAGGILLNVSPPDTSTYPGQAALYLGGAAGISATPAAMIEGTPGELFGHDIR